MFVYTCCKCNKEVQVNQKPTSTRMCRSCAAKERIKRKQANPDIGICEFCGKPFERHSNKQRYCKGPHIRQCPVCNKEYVEDNVENLKRPPVACSYACRAQATKQTSLKRYGCAAPGNNLDSRKKTQLQMINKYGAPYTLQSQQLKSTVLDTMVRKYGVTNPMQIPEIQAKAQSTCLQKYGFTFCPNNRISNLNKEFANSLNEHQLKTEFELKLENKSYDIHIQNTNILIEIDPTYTHNIIGNHWGMGVDKLYHSKKSQIASDNGYRCIHIFDWDDKDKIIDMLSPKKRVYARKCEIYKLNADVAVKFLNEYHLQGSCRGQLLCLGLVYQNELLQVMTFGKPRYDKHHDVELLRLCTKPGYAVIGGASRLFSYATNEFGLNNIISYCDRSKFTGAVYEKLGMRLIRTSPPQEVWSQDNKRVTANLLRSRGYDQLFKTNYGKGVSNEQLMLENGWLPVYDCGQYVYEYK